MDQSPPAGRGGTDERYETINRRIQPREFEEAVRAAQNAGLYRLDSGASAPRASCGPCLKGAEPCAKITWRTLQGQAPCISCRDSRRSSGQRRSVLDQLWRRIRPVVRLDQLALARDLSVPLADLPLARGITLRTAAPEDLPRLVAAMQQVFRRPLLEEFEQRYERGHVCGIAEKDGEIRLMVWVRFDEASQLQMGAHVRLRPGEVYAYALFAPPEYRRRGLATTVGDFMLRWLGGRASLLNHVVYDPTDPLGEWCSPERLRFAGGLSVFRRGQVL